MKINVFCIFLVINSYVSMISDRHFLQVISLFLDLWKGTLMPGPLLKFLGLEFRDRYEDDEFSKQRSERYEKETEIRNKRG